MSFRDGLVVPLGLSAILHRMSSEKIFTPSFVMLASCNFLGAMNFYLLTAIFTEFSLKTYDVGYSTAALSVSLYIIGALCARVLLGGQIDKWGIKASLLVGYVLIAVSSCAYVFPLPFELLVAIRFVQGLGFGISSSAGASGAAVMVPASRRSEGIGYFSMTQALATGIGPFVAILLINITGDYTALFATTAAMAVIMTVLAFFVQIPPVAAKPADGARKSAGPRQGGLSRFLHPLVVPFGLVMLLAYLCYAGLITYMTLYAAQIDASDLASLYFVIYAAAILISRPPMGRRADRQGENAVVFYTLPCLALGLVVLALAGFLSMPWLLLLSAALTGFGIGSTHSVLQALVAKTVPQNELGLGNSTYLMMLDLGSGIGPVLLGFLVPVIGYAAIYLLLAVVAVLALALYVAVHGRKA